VFSGEMPLIPYRDVVVGTSMVAI